MTASYLLKRVSDLKKSFDMTKRVFQKYGNPKIILIFILRKLEMK